MTKRAFQDLKPSWVSYKLGSLAADFALNGRIDLDPDERDIHGRCWTSPLTALAGADNSWYGEVPECDVHHCPGGPSYLEVPSDRCGISGRKVVISLT